ncbi:MAG: hypothetical protein WCJ59_01430 [bacterium]
MISKRLIFILLLIGIFLPMSFTLAGTILSTNKYAWNDNSGYINFENVIVDDTMLSGFAWSSNSGWIKFNPALGGVLNDGQGHLSGYAWGEGLGWINFTGVNISTTSGKFSGTATGEQAGKINFNCPNYCDVRTDWRPPVGSCTSWSYSSWGSCISNSQSRTILSSLPSGCTGGSPVLNQSCSISNTGNSGGGGGGVFIPNPIASVQSHVETINDDLIIKPEQSGTYTKETKAGNIVLDVPVAAISEKLTFYISEEPLVAKNHNLISIETILVNSSFYNVTARNQTGELVHYFPKPITLTLPIPKELIGFSDLGVYWLNEINQQWVLIPDAIFVNGKAVFTVSHLTKFAIFRTNIKEETREKTPVTTSVDTASSSQASVIIKPRQSLPLGGVITSTTPLSLSTTSASNILNQIKGESDKTKIITLLFICLLLVILFYIRHKRIEYRNKNSK